MPASSHQNLRAQVETNLFGPVNVTRAVLPVMRARRSGLVITISSLAGIVGQEFVSAYGASKFGVEGWMESLAPEVAPFGIRTMIVEPGSLPLDSFDVSLAPGEPAALLAARDGRPGAAGWELRELSPGPGYAAAVAAEGGGWRLRCWRWPADDVAPGGR